MDIKEKIKSLPLSCGVYIMKSKKGEVLYVGKASSLKRRVASYFLKNVSLKTGFLMARVCDINYIECDSEEQALVLEAALIKEKKPKYNIALRDDKSYPFVEITQEQFPRVFITRKRTNKKSLYFGPYPDVGTLKSVLNMIRRIFSYCSCKCFKNTECLFAHIKLCPAPCVGKISQALYKENIEGIKRVLKGEREELMSALRVKMRKLSQRKRYEEAAAARDKIIALENLYKGKNLTHELIALREALNLSSLPLQIEAIDISSLSGTNATGSVVVFKNAVADKNSYRRYRIKEVFSTDDYAMIAEVVRRRYRRLLDEKRNLPELIVIDGGLGHVQAAKMELDKLQLKTPVISIAKRNEEIWFAGKSKPLVIPKDSAALHLIQRLRDEAHRFARKYHLLLRKKKTIN
ncbi:MAG: excinuclease ABC subunit UvrC [Candidatus Omnitrophica bacterium]|jgi:excinuclease ABC subunit C|nr:excinuclease ABC subunit UvrC [Candidatus Omnitrophota bacterium]